MKSLLPVMLILCGLFEGDPAFAQTWTQTSAPNSTWQAMASSADGSKLVAVATPAGSFPGSIYTSTDSGVTWTSNNVPSDQQWWSVASSADGVNLAAVVSYGGIYTSTNSGATWTLCTNAPNEYWYSIASSADGTRLVAAPYLDISGNSLPIYISADSGKTWTATSSPSNNWAGVASSADGSKLVALVATGGLIYLSTDSGGSWTSNNTVAYWKSVACSVDGTKLVAVAEPGLVYTSTNSGVTWNSHYVFGTGITGFGSVASSADGTKLAAVGYEDFASIYISTNSGISWIKQTNAPIAVWDAIASSADGNKLFATTYGSVNGNGGIYTLQITPAPQLNLTPSDTNLAFSWTIPSTNFALQQNYDLNTTNWVILTNTPTLNLTNLQDEVTLSPTNSSGFFRLISQ